MTSSLPRTLREPQAQKAHDIVGMIRPLLRLHEQAPRGRDPADGREVVVGERHSQDRRLPLWRPSPHRHGQEVEARLVYPDDGSPFLGGFFPRAGQRSCHQAWMAASSRCAARAWGR